MNLEHTEIEAISRLKDDFGFKMLLDRIQAEIDTLNQEMLEPGSPVNKEMVLYWRAMSLIFRILKTTPEQMEKEFQVIKQNLQYQYDEDSKLQVDPAFLDLLIKTYENKN